MAINLDAALQARMDGIERTPIIELISSQFLQDIPFTGLYMNDLQTSEGNTSLSVDVNNRIVGTLIRGNAVYFIYSDDERLQLYETLVMSGVLAPTDANVCPMTNGNVAIVYTRNYDIYRIIVDPEGNIVSGATLIYDFTDSVWTSTPYAILLQDGSYLMAVTYRQTVSLDYFIGILRSEDFNIWGHMLNIEGV